MSTSKQDDTQIDPGLLDVEDVRQLSSRALKHALAAQDAALMAKVESTELDRMGAVEGLFEDTRAQPFWKNIQILEAELKRRAESRSFLSRHWVLLAAAMIFLMLALGFLIPHG